MSKVILNYDCLPGLDRRFPDAVLIPFIPGGSQAKFSMCDTVVMADRPAISTEQMCAYARKAAPLAKDVIVLGRSSDPSHGTKQAKFPANGPATVRVLVPVM